MKIFFSPQVRVYLRELSELLYEKEYFGFEEDAYKYVEDIINDIVASLHHKSKKTAPEYFSVYGKNLLYAVFKKNNNTQWYVFFNYEDDIYYIRYIGNNHNCAQYF